ncbi:MAG TPA: GNAT family N-acetyltransferase [Desulfatiglandales bacterium]|nr:GNAT family N-acetyltransferase [Desulfatiglandales bacterium]
MAGKSKIAVVRRMTEKDLDAVVAIDTKVLGKSRWDYWLGKMSLTEQRLPIVSLVAETDGKVVGFILGDASGYEYDVPENIGWIDTIGVDPDYQKRGIARMLMKEMIANLKKVGIDTIYTMVNWPDWDLLKFFHDSGFQKGPLINLELKI